MHWAPVIGAGLGALAVSAAGTPLVLRLLSRRAILDHPNPRSSHEVPTPRGGGIAVIAALILAWLAIGLFRSESGYGLWLILGLSTLLAAFSWLDDLKGLSPALRLVLQAGAVAAGLQAFAPDQLVFQGLLPLALDRLFAGLLWLWFLNVFNFMDGIDGITGTETLFIAAGLVLLALFSVAPFELGGLALALGAAALGFLPWNWERAKIFLGDVGSVPLGFATGWLLLGLAVSGLWAAALILPGYYLADATLTLTRRAIRGERFWQAHREHAYQRAVRAGRSHAQVVYAIAAVNAGLIGLAFASLLGPQALWASLGGALVLVGFLLWYLPRPKGRASDAS